MICKSYIQITYLSWKIPDNAIAISRIMKAPQKNPSLKVVQGDPCLSPKGGTLKTKQVFTITEDSFRSEFQPEKLKKHTNTTY